MKINLAFVAAFATAACLASPAAAESYKMQGSPVLAHVMVGAAPLLQQQGIDIKVTVEGNNTIEIGRAHV